MKKSTEPDLRELAEAAFRQAAKVVIERAKQTGTPLILWENGAVKKVDPHRFRLKPKRRQKKR
jgi:hypothetical protein